MVEQAALHGARALLTRPPLGPAMRLPAVLPMRRNDPAAYAQKIREQAKMDAFRL